MLLILEGNTSIFLFIYGIVSGLIFAGVSSIFVDEIFIPFYYSAKEYLKTNEKFPGKTYRFVNTRLANKLMLSEDKMTTPLKMEGYEYRIYNIDGKIQCRRSHISVLKQIGSNKFRGTIHRNDRLTNKKSINDFLGYKKKNADYLIIEEYKKGAEKRSPYHSTAYYYFPDNFPSDIIVGIALENDKALVQKSISVLSFGKDSRTSGITSRLLKKIDKAYLKMFNIDITDKQSIDETIQILE